MILRSVDPLKSQCNVASSQGDKNQYADTLPYDHSRVVLSKKPSDENSHYINASYVPSWLREKSYVVTQAVKSKPASNEFWRMIWELRANTIVMLTKVFDFMRVMCLQYWPVTVFTYGEIIVETLETKTYAHFVSTYQ
uniref:Tyrosine-protein phosphatase domain-containing protein n=2 Tax=Panagrolaimus sp. ES5 TaxID=591445 RepID=A0AC34EZT5_9BILA